MAPNSTNNTNDDIFSTSDSATISKQSSRKTKEAADSKRPSSSAGKKSHKGLIIGLVAGVAVVAGGAGAFSVYRSQPNIVAADAAINLVNTKNLSVTGTIDMQYDKKFASDFGFNRITLTIDSVATSPLPASSKAKLAVESDTYGDFEIELSNVVASDGVLYLQANGVEGALDKWYEANIQKYLEYNKCDSNYSTKMACDYSSSYYNSSSMKQQYKTFKSYFQNTFDLIDNTWWKIDIEALINSIDDETELEIDNDYSTAYKCLVSQVDNPDNSKEISALYRQYPFITIKQYTGSDAQAQSGSKLYNINMDAEALTDFAKGTINSGTFSRVQSCFKKIDDFDILDPSDIKESDWKEFKKAADKNLSDIENLYIGIDDWSHRLTSLQYSHTEKKAGTVSVDLKFNYNATTVSIPDDAKDITELVETFASDYAKAARYSSLY